MYSKMEFTNNSAQTVNLLGSVASTGFVAIKQASYNLGERTVDRPKMEANGSWATFMYYQNLIIELEGDVIAATPEDFNTFKQDMIQKMLPSAAVLQTTRTHGSFVIRLLGLSEDYSVPVVVQTLLMPQSADKAPSASDLRIVLKAFRPYFQGLTSTNFFWVT
jgi:hypothetical protein